MLARHAGRHSHSGVSNPPQGGLTPEQRKLTPREEASFAQLETELGGRAGLIAALQVAHLPAKLDAALGLIADPLHDHETLGQVCVLAGVKVGDLLDVLQAASLVKGRLLATQRIAQGLPDVAAAVMDAAIPGLKTCPRCLGARWVSKPTNEDREAQAECPECRGTGEVVFEPDHKTQVTALKLGGLLHGGGKGGGAGNSITVLQANTQVHPGDPATYDGMIGLLDRVLYGEGRERLPDAGGSHTVIDLPVEPVKDLPAEEPDEDDEDERPNPE